MDSPIRITKQTGQVLAGAGVLGLVALYFRFDPGQASFFPPCPFRLLTGLQCPGCGSQRCLHQLMHGHLAQAYGYNPLLVLSLPYVLVGLLMEYTPLQNRYAAVRNRFYGKTAGRIAFAVVVVYWIGRNLV